MSMRLAALGLTKAKQSSLGTFLEILVERLLEMSEKIGPWFYPIPLKRRHQWIIDGHTAGENSACHKAVR